MGVWRPEGCHLVPFALPQDKTPGEMPVYARKIFAAAEAFRAVSHREFGQTWKTQQPRAPLTKLEAKQLLSDRMERDELYTLQKLATLGSTSAGVLVRLKLPREIAQAVFRSLSGERAAQVTISTVLSGTLFRVLGKTGLAPAGCGKCHIVEDSFDHLRVCYRLTHLYATGEQVVEFLVTVAKRAKLTPPGASKPSARYR